jgi:hypothetical protein
MNDEQWDAWVAKRKQVLDYRATHQADGSPLPPNRKGKRKAEHGTASTYKSGCRCQPCRDANREHGRNYRARLKACG